MTLKLRQIAAALLAAAICLGSAAATETVSAPEEVSVDSSVPATDPSDRESGEDVAVQEPGAEEYPPTETTVPEEQPPSDQPQEEIPQEPEVYDPYGDKKLRIGLAYPGNSAGALVSANLLNADVSAVSGYRVGYYDGNMAFHPLAATEETALTMVKTTNIYRVGESYSDTKPAGNYELLGCYHLQRPFAFATYEEAMAMVDSTLNSFISWVDGVYYVRSGSFATYDEAKAAADAEPAANWSISYTSVYGINVVKTGTCQILFQFDGGEKTPLGVMPGLETTTVTSAAVS